MTRVPKISSLGATISGGVLFLSAAVGIFAGFTAAGEPLWGTLSFELVLMVSGLLACLLGMGRFIPGFGMAAGVLGVTALGAVALGYLDARTNLAQTWAGPYLKPLLGIRVVFILGLIICGGFAALSRDAKNIRRFIIGLIVLGPVVGMALAGQFGLLGALTRKASGNMELLRVGGLFLISVLMIGLVSAGGHYLITAFLSKPDESETENA